MSTARIPQRNRACLYTGPTQVRHWANRLRLALVGAEVFEGTERVWIWTTRERHEVNRDLIAMGLPEWVLRDLLLLR